MKPDSPFRLFTARHWYVTLLLWMVVMLAAAFCVATAMAALGQIPWPVIFLRWGDLVWPEAGMWLQLALTVLLLALCFSLPVKARLDRPQQPDPRLPEAILPGRGRVSAPPPRGRTTGRTRTADPESDEGRNQSQIRSLQAKAPQLSPGRGPEGLHRGDGLR